MRVHLCMSCARWVLQPEGQYRHLILFSFLIFGNPWTKGHHIQRKRSEAKQSSCSQLGSSSALQTRSISGFYPCPICWNQRLPQPSLPSLTKSFQPSLGQRKCWTHKASTFSWFRSQKPKSSWDLFVRKRDFWKWGWQLFKWYLHVLAVLPRIFSHLLLFKTHHIPCKAATMPWSTPARHQTSSLQWTCSMLESPKAMRPCPSAPLLLLR